MKTVKIDGIGLTIKDVVAVARENAPVEIAKEAIVAMEATRRVVDDCVKNERVAYGITTGFGELARVRIPVEQAAALQYNLVRSHTSGVGRPLERDAARASMLVRANTLAVGASGVRPAVAEQVAAFLNAGITPVIPSQGSVGASGDLAPSAHMALALIGEGKAEYKGKVVASEEALRDAGLRKLTLESKEGLSIINGTQVMTGIGALCVEDATWLYKAAVVAAAMSIEAMGGSVVPLDPRIHAARRHPGQVRTADALKRLLAGSGVLEGLGSLRIQDAYSMRCAPQVMGPCIEAIEHVRATVEIEMNSASDNPLVFAHSAKDSAAGELGVVCSNGNFHGEPVALAMDFLGIAVAEVASIAERRVARLMDAHVSGLPAFLSPKSGLNSGFMMAQYTAAALVSENKVLAHPACVDSIPTSANQEDHVSMGTIAARKCRDIIANARNVVAVELYSAAQGLSLRKGLAPAKATAAALKVIREVVPFLEDDRVVSNDILAISSLIENGAIVKAVEDLIGSI